MTHGGLNSLQEAIYHGVPVIGLPFMTDQHLNLKRAVADGYAIQLDWKDVNEQSLTDTLQRILHNSR
jgi:glucuronosyltransferase